MTNEQIIFNERCELMKSGIIGGTGRIIEFETDNGEKIQLEEPEEIHTFAAWKAKGFSVKKGEHAKASFTIWKCTTKKAEKKDDEDTKRMFLKKAHFFTAAQVEPLKH